VQQVQAIQLQLQFSLRSIERGGGVGDFAGAVAANGRGAGLTLDPPINALRQPISDMAGWSQVIRVDNVLPNDISSTFTQPLGTTDLMRVSVTVRYRKPGEASAQAMTTLSWVVGK
jgi:hypothetical protein